MPTDNVCVFRLRLCQVSLCKCQVAACLFHGSFRLRDVRAGDFTNLEPITRGFQFFAQQTQVVHTQIHEFLLTEDLEIGEYRAQKHVLFDLKQQGAGRQNRLLGGVDAQTVCAKVIDLPRGVDADTCGRLADVLRARPGRRRPYVAKIAGHVARPGDDRLQQRSCDRDIFIRHPQQGPVLVQKTAVRVGTDQSIRQRVSFCVYSMQ